jgi:hypothetical protein
VRQSIFDAGLAQYLGGDTIASGAGLLTSLRIHPCRLWAIDEFGHFLESAMGKKAASHRAGIIAELLKLYSRAKGVYRGAEYADQSRQGRPREDIQQPHACLLATTTGVSLWQAMASGAVQDGTLARMLLFVAQDSYPTLQKRPAIYSTMPELAEALKAVAAGAEGYDAGNLGAIMSAETAPKPYTVPSTAEADRLRDGQTDEGEAWLRKVRDTAADSIVGRVRENANKLALIRAISGNPMAPRITAEDHAWGWALANHCARAMLRETEQNVAENPMEAHHKKVLAVVRKAGKGGITHSDLLRATQFLAVRERNDILHALTEGGQISAVAQPTKTKPVTLYLAAHPETTAR